MGPTLGVTHIIAFSLAPKAPTMRIVRLPAGPSLSFRIERYSLVKDVLNSKKRKRSKGLEYLTPPLVSPTIWHSHTLWHSDGPKAGLGRVSCRSFDAAPPQSSSQVVPIYISLSIAQHNISVLC